MIDNIKFDADNQNFMMLYAYLVKGVTERADTSILPQNGEIELVQDLIGLAKSAHEVVEAFFIVSNNNFTWDGVVEYDVIYGPLSQYIVEYSKERKQLPFQHKVKQKTTALMLEFCEMKPEQVPSPKNRVKPNFNYAPEQMKAVALCTAHFTRRDIEALHNVAQSHESVWVRENGVVLRLYPDFPVKDLGLSEYGAWLIKGLVEQDYDVLELDSAAQCHHHLEVFDW